MNLFEKNVGMVDRIIRIIVGFGILGYSAAYIAPPLSYLLILIGIVILVTGAMGTCAIYSALGINTAGKAAPKKTKRGK